MATLDRNPSRLIGISWSQFAEAMKDEDEDGNDEEISSQPSSRASDTIKLKREDKWLYGFCPAQDEFYLVVCEACGQVVKPQALKSHIEQRHANMPGGFVPKSGSSILTRSSSDAARKAAGGRKGLSTPQQQQPQSKPLTHSKQQQRQTQNSSAKNHVMPIVKVERMANSGEEPLADDASAPSGDHSKANHHNQRQVVISKVIEDPDPPSVTIPKDRQEKGPPKLAATVTEIGGEGSKEVILNIPSPQEGQDQDFILLSRGSTPAASPSPPPLQSSSALSSALTSSKLHSSLPLQQKVGVAAITKPTQMSGEGVVKTSSPLIATATAAKQAPVLVPKIPTAASSSSHLTAKTVTTSAITMATTMVVSMVTSTTTSTSSFGSKSWCKKNKSPKQKDEKFIPCALREYDCDRHCGVWNAETKAPCTRSLTCKTHALSLRRAVQGRSKSFDLLLREHKEAKEAMQRAKGKLPPLPSPSSISSKHRPSALLSPTSVPSSSPPPPRREEAHPGHRSSSSSMVSAPLAKLGKAAAAKIIPNTLLNRPNSLPVFPANGPLLPMEIGDESISSDADELEDEDGDDLDGPTYISHPPRPLAVNSFGAWRHGNGCYVFNRRTDLVRSAFAAALDAELHPPPHKKLCVESKLPKGSSTTSTSGDPYDFMTSAPASESDSQRKHHHHHHHHHHHSHRPPSNGVPSPTKSSNSSHRVPKSSSNNNIVSSSSLSSSSSSSKVKSKPLSGSSSSSAKSSNIVKKRKSSSSSIPASSHAQSTSNPNRNNVHVSSGDAVVNGQVADVSSHDVSALYNNLTSDGDRTKGKRTKGMFSPDSDCGALSPVSSNAMCESPTGGSPLSNGLVSSPLGKSFSKRIPSPSYELPEQIFATSTSVSVYSSVYDSVKPHHSHHGHHRSLSSQPSKSSSGSRSSLSTPTAQQLAAAALNLTSSFGQEQLFSQLHSNAVLTSPSSTAAYSSLQFQPKAAMASSKVAMQPVALTLVAPSNVSHQTQSSRLLLPPDRDSRHKPRDITSQVQNSPSNVFS